MEAGKLPLARVPIVTPNPVISVPRLLILSLPLSPIFPVLPILLTTVLNGLTLLPPAGPTFNMMLLHTRMKW